MSHLRAIRPAAFIIPALLLVVGTGVWLYIEQLPEPVFDAVMPYAVGVSTPTPYGEFRYLDRKPIPQGADYLTVEIPLAMRTTVWGDKLVGETIAIGPRKYVVEAIRPWSGLMRDIAGPPMAEVAVKLEDGPWITPIFCRENEWELVENSVAILLEWAYDKEAAQERIDAGTAIANASRWGVQDGNVMQWSSSFLAGTGFDLADGTSVTLLRHEPEREGGAAILVQVVREGETSERWVPVNEAEPEAIIHYEDPTAFPAVLHLVGVSEDLVAFRMYSGAESVCSGTVDTNGFTSCSLPPLSFRLMNALPGAVFIDENDTHFREAILTSEDDIVRVRQGEVVTVDGHRLSLEANVRDDQVRYQFAWRPTAGEWQTFELEPEGSVAMNVPRRIRFDNTPEGVRVRVYGDT